MTRFAGKVAFVTGATSGTALAFAHERASVLVADGAALTVGHAMVVDGGQTA